MYLVRTSEGVKEGSHGGSAFPNHQGFRGEETFLTDSQSHLLSCHAIIAKLSILFQAF